MFATSPLGIVLVPRKDARRICEHARLNRTLGMQMVTGGSPKKCRDNASSEEN
jgi:hypothetical protein